MAHRNPIFVNSGEKEICRTRNSYSMKIRSLLILISILITTVGFAQTNAEGALRSYLGDASYVEISNSSPEKLELLQFQNERGYYITQNPGKWSEGELEDVLSVAPRNEEFPVLTIDLLQSGIDFLAYEFVIPAAGYHYYRIGNTDQILVVLSDKLVKDLKQRTE